MLDLRKDNNNLKNNKTDNEINELKKKFKTIHIKYDKNLYDKDLIRVKESFEDLINVSKKMEFYFNDDKDIEYINNNNKLTNILDNKKKKDNISNNNNFIIWINFY